jgi:hypothetical protein
MQKMIADSGFPQDRIKSIFRVGHPLEELLRVVEEEKIDLVVRGSKGRSDHPRLLVGSVAQRMFRYSPVSVLILPREVASGPIYGLSPNFSTTSLLRKENAYDSSEFLRWICAQPIPFHPKMAE